MDWVELSYSNQGLSFFEGGCSYIESTAVKIQLRKGFEKSKTLLWIYNREEILAHEAVHAMRCAFSEPKFEEILAYQTSKSPFRRYFGPIFRNPKESMIFLVPALLSTFTFLWFPVQIILLGSAIKLLGFGILRLAYYQRLFSRTKKKIVSLLRNPNDLLNVLLRLSDKEIIEFSRLSSSDIINYLRSKNELRCKQILSFLD